MSALFGGSGAEVTGFAFLMVVPTLLLWRICSRAGLPSVISLLALVPLVGALAVLALLAVVPWPSLRHSD